MKWISILHERNENISLENIARVQQETTDTAIAKLPSDPRSAQRNTKAVPIQRFNSNLPKGKHKVSSSFLTKVAECLPGEDKGNIEKARNLIYRVQEICPSAQVWRPQRVLATVRGIGMRGRISARQVAMKMGWEPTPHPDVQDQEILVPIGGQPPRRSR